MGYYATGSIDVTWTEEVAAKIKGALAELTAASECSELPPHWGVQAIIEAATGFELQYDDLDKIKGETTARYYYSGKWRDQEDVLEILARCGAEIIGDYTGEDDNSWEYSTPKGGGLLSVMPLAKLAVDQYLALADIRDWIKANGVSEVPDDLAELLKVVLISEPGTV